MTIETFDITYTITDELLDELSRLRELLPILGRDELYVRLPVEGFSIQTYEFRQNEGSSRYLFVCTFSYEGHEDYSWLTPEDMVEATLTLGPAFLVVRPDAICLWAVRTEAHRVPFTDFPEVNTSEREYLLYRFG